MEHGIIAWSGINTILPPTSFTGSKRYMYSHFQDAKAIVQEYGRPQLFITMACNTKWPEITRELEEGQNPYDRPDIICQVFEGK